MATKNLNEQIKEAEAALAKLKEEQAKEAYKAYYDAVDYLKKNNIEPKAFIAWHRETFKQPILTVEIELPAGREVFTRYDTDLAAPKREIKAALKALGRSTLTAAINPEYKAKGSKFVETLFN